MKAIEGVSLRPFLPTDVDVINRLFCMAYGPSYPYKVASVLSEGSYCYCAVDALHQEVVGFARSSWLGKNYYLVHELGGYVVHPDFRRRGIGEELSRRCEQAARFDSAQMHILNSEPVTWGNGLASQRIFERHGFRVLGLEIMKYPDISPEHHDGQPASMTIVARRADNTNQFLRRNLYVPRDYEELIASIMSGCPRSSAVDLNLPMPEVVHHQPVRVGNKQGSEFVDIPANWPQSNGLIKEKRTAGWKFCAFLPEHGAITSGGRTVRFDYIRLYRPTLRCDWSLIGVLSSAQYIKQFVEAE